MSSFESSSSDMDIETARTAVDYLLEKSPVDSSVMISFFGGEPLLKFKLMKEVVHYAKQKDVGYKKIHFSLTTNGTLMSSEIAEFLSTHGFTIGVSIDGRKKAHDLYRCFSNGRGSYEQVISAINSFKDKNRKTGVMTLTPQGIPDFYQLLENSGESVFDNWYVNLVRNEKHCFHFDDDRIEAIAKRYLDYLSTIQKGGEPVSANVDLCGFGDILVRIHKRSKRNYGCRLMAGINTLVISSDGQIWPCYRVIGNEEYRLGRLETGIESPQVRRQFLNSNVDNRFCGDCPYKYLCGGGCVVDSMLFYRDKNVPFSSSCSLAKKIIEGALSLYVDLFGGYIN